MINFKHFLKSFLRGKKTPYTEVKWIKKDEGSLLSKIFTEDHISQRKSIYSEEIEVRAAKTNDLGPQLLWEGYAGNNVEGSTRMPNLVRTSAIIGNLYTYLVQVKKPNVIVEFGTAFGVSGMFFLAGINLNKKGELLTFEPNDIWAKTAKENLACISDKFQLINGTFEENIRNVLPQNQFIDMAFIDAIHTKEFVIPQLDLVVSKSNNKAIIILDDIGFSDDMRDCWYTVSNDSRFSSSVTVGSRVGIVELK